MTHFSNVGQLNKLPVED